MDPDLRDLLSAWLGGEIEPPRREALLTRLQTDEEFRRAFVDEVRMLGMLKVVHSTEPRWLRLEDELGWSARERKADDSLVAGIASRLNDPPRRRVRLRGLRWAGAALVLSAAGVALWSQHRAPMPAPVTPRPLPPPLAKVDVSRGLAMIIGLDGVQWNSPEASHPSKGDILGVSGRLKFQSGRATLAMLSGVVFIVEGPADIELISIDHVYCHQGKLRARVPEGAEGFLVSGPGSAVLDLGTEFGLNIENDGKSRGKVFEGEVEAGVMSTSGTLRRSRLMRKGSNAFVIDPGSGRIEPLTTSADFVSPLNLVSPALALDRSYASTIVESRPWAYWRFERETGGMIANEVAGRPALRVTGPIQLAETAPGNRCAVFGAGESEQYLAMDSLWQPPRSPGHAVELWFLPERIDHSALVSMVAPKDSMDHLWLLELTSKNRLTLFRPASLRFLYRWPAARGGGDNLFSSAAYVPYRWHHLVAQRQGDRMELYMDGAKQASLPLNPDAATTPCQLLLGRLTTLTDSPLHHTGYRRAFVGRLDEVALYDRPLSDDEIERHFRLATRGDAEAAPTQ